MHQLTVCRRAQRIHQGSDVSIRCTAPRTFPYKPPPKKTISHGIEPASQRMSESVLTHKALHLSAHQNQCEHVKSKVDEADVHEYGREEAPRL